MGSSGGSRTTFDITPSSIRFMILCKALSPGVVIPVTVIHKQSSIEYDVLPYFHVKAKLKEEE